MEIVVRSFQESDWQSVANIYNEGIATGIATFETQVPDWTHWNKKYLISCRIVALVNKVVIGFAVLAPVSNRLVYNGVAEVSLYVAKAYQGNHIGEMLLRKLINESEADGIWTLQASIFSENSASINLHLKCGFRTIGVRERIGQLNKRWHDNYLLERRSNKIN